MFQASEALQIPGGIDNGLDAQGATVLEVLLDAGVLEERIQGDLSALGDDLRFAGSVIHDRMPLVGMWGVAGEEQLDSFGATDIEVVGDERFEEAAGMPRSVEDEGARRFNLTH